MPLLSALFCLGLSAAPTAAAAPAAPVTQALPLRRVRLYEIGVAYYERRGRMQKGKHSALPLPTSHIDDALKTLVVLSGDDQVRVAALSYPTTVTRDAARVLAGLPDEGQPLDYGLLLRSLQGQRVGIRGQGQTLQGRLVQVQGPLSMPPVHLASATDALTLHPQTQDYELVLLRDDGGLARLRTDEIDAVEPLDEGRRERLEMAAQSLSSTRAQQTSGFEFEVLRSGDVALGYVGESALWGINYRLVMTGDDSKLQAWALVHNDGDEDWHEVDIELVNGEPRSFIFAQASPHYMQRAVEVDEREVYLTPQLAGATPDEMAYGSVEGYGGMGLIGHGRGGGGVGYGMGGGANVGVVGRGSISGEVQLGDLAELAQADGSESGAQFIYRLPEGVDLQAHHSALLPVFTSPIDGRAITYWRDGQASAAVRLENDTRQTLPAGTISMFSGGGFAGEAHLSRMKPGEAQFIEFGLKLDVEVERERLQRRLELARVESDGEGLGGRMHFVASDESKLTVSNRAGHAKRVVVALDLPQNAKVSGAKELDWDEARAEALLTIEVGAATKASQTYTSESNQEQAFTWEQFKDAQLLEFAASPRLSTRSAKGLREMVRLRAEQRAIDAQRAIIEADLSKLGIRLEAARKDMAALGQGGARGDAVRKAAKRLAALEKRVEELDRKADGLDEREHALVLERVEMFKLFRAEA